MEEESIKQKALDLSTQKKQGFEFSFLEQSSEIMKPKNVEEIDYQYKKTLEDSMENRIQLFGKKAKLYLE